MHILPIGLRENLHWVPRVMYESHGDPIPRRVLVMERLYAEEQGLPVEPLPLTGGDETAPPNTDKAGD
jgi:hypothetical protein